MYYECFFLSHYEYSGKEAFFLCGIFFVFARHSVFLFVCVVLYVVVRCVLFIYFVTQSALVPGC